MKLTDEDVQALRELTTKYGVKVITREDLPDNGPNFIGEPFAILYKGPLVLTQPDPFYNELRELVYDRRLYTEECDDFIAVGARVVIRTYGFRCVYLQVIPRVSFKYIDLKIRFEAPSELTTNMACVGD